MVEKLGIHVIFQTTPPSGMGEETMEYCTKFSDLTYANMPIHDHL